MTRWPLVLIVLLGVASNAASVCAQASPKDQLVERVDRGLAFLARMQEKEGAWKGGGDTHPAITSLAVMAFLSAGHVPGEGPYQANVSRGVRWILEKQRADGMLAHGGFQDMYHHGINTMMLCEVMGMSDAGTAREMRPKLEKAVKLILHAQRTEPGPYQGGWRYQVAGVDADLSVSGWQILALRSARNLGCDVPAERIDLALKFVENCRDPGSGAYAYVPGSSTTISCTGTGILAFELCRKERQPSRTSGGAYLIKNSLKPGEPHFYYAAYYTTQAMFQLGGNYWTVHRNHLHRLLLESQQQNGGWISNDTFGGSYNTAMAILALTVEYRLLPLYQRDEESDGRTKK